MLVSSQALHHEGLYQDEVRPGFIENQPGIQIHTFKLAHPGSWTCLPHVNTDKRQTRANCSGKTDRCVMVQQSSSSQSEWAERTERRWLRQFASVSPAKWHPPSAAGVKGNTSEEQDAEAQNAQKFRPDGGRFFFFLKRRRIRRSADKREGGPSRSIPQKQSAHSAYRACTPASLLIQSDSSVPLY